MRDKEWWLNYIRKAASVLVKDFCDPSDVDNYVDCFRLAVEMVRTEIELRGATGEAVPGPEQLARELIAEEKHKEPQLSDVITNYMRTLLLKSP